MIIKKSLSKSPRNLILNQLMLDFEAYNKSNSNEFEFDNVANVIQSGKIHKIVQVCHTRLKQFCTTVPHWHCHPVECI